MGTHDAEPTERGWLVSVLPSERSEYVLLVYALVLVWGAGRRPLDVLRLRRHRLESLRGQPLDRGHALVQPASRAGGEAAVVLYAGIVLLECRSLVERVSGWRLWLGALVVAGILVTVNNITVGVIVLVG